MEFISNLFNLFLYQPMVNILVFFYEYVPGKDFGVAIILLTVLIKLALYPLGSRAIKSQKELAEIQPQIKEIQEKYKNNKEEQTKKLFELYKEKRMNPFSGCLPVLIQLPVLIAIYRVFWRGFDPAQLDLLYGFMPDPGAINSVFLGMVDLSRAPLAALPAGGYEIVWPGLILAIVVSLLQFVQIKMVSQKSASGANKNEFSAQMQKQMQYFMPFFMAIILLRLPAALGLYFLTTNLFTIAQQYHILKEKNKGNHGKISTGKN